jgi:glucose/arabinose dehydrogenase
MRQGSLAVFVVLLFLAAACSNGPGEGVTQMVTTTESPPEATSTEGETDAPALPTTVPDPPAEGTNLGLRLVATGLDAPVFATAAPGQLDRLYVVEQPGRIRILEIGGGKTPTLLDEPFLDISSKVESGGERGFLSAVFHPEYESNGLFYVNYTDLNGDTRVVEYRDLLEGPVQTRELLRVQQPYANHNGGQLAFGPDGLLYVGMGDGGSSGDPENRAQDLTSKLGKLLRVDVDRPGSRWEMVGYGLRNPWRFSFDRVTGDLWIGDVGQGRLEEIDFVPAAELGELHNFGWDVFEGTEEFEDKQLRPEGTVVEPLTEYSHDLGCSVTGGYVYRGEALRDEAWGRYFYGDYCSGTIWSLALWEGQVSRRAHGFEVDGLSSFAEGPRGQLYALSVAGSIYQLVSAM